MITFRQKGDFSKADSILRAKRKESVRLSDLDAVNIWSRRQPPLRLQHQLTLGRTCKFKTALPRSSRSSRFPCQSAFYNTNIQNGVPIAVDFLQYGHTTRNGEKQVQGEEPTSILLSSRTTKLQMRHGRRLLKL